MATDAYYLGLQFFIRLYLVLYTLLVFLYVHWKLRGISTYEHNMHHRYLWNYWLAMLELTHRNISKFDIIEVRLFFVETSRKCAVPFLILQQQNHVNHKKWRLNTLLTWNIRRRAESLMKSLKTCNVADLRVGGFRSPLVQNLKL